MHQTRVWVVSVQVGRKEQCITTRWRLEANKHYYYNYHCSFFTLQSTLRKSTTLCVNSYSLIKEEKKNIFKVF